jgi:hypothetical protein
LVGLAICIFCVMRHLRPYCLVVYCILRWLSPPLLSLWVGGPQAYYFVQIFKEDESLFSYFYYIDTVPLII